jgi:hypothetical protein
MDARSRKNCCRGRTIGITYSGCVFVALVIQYAKRMSRIFICGLSDSTIFFTYHIRQDFREEVWNTKMCSFFLYVQSLSEIFLFQKRIAQDTVIKMYRYPYKAPVILLRFQWKFNFLDSFSWNNEISWKSVEWEPSCSMRTDGRTDRHDEANCLFLSQLFKYA